MQKVSSLLGNGSQLVSSPQELRNCSQLVLSPHTSLWASMSESKQFPFQLDGHKKEDLFYGTNIIVSNMSDDLVPHTSSKKLPRYEFP